MDCLKINFCAAPSSYKSTVCVGVEALLKQEGIITDTSREYVREYINSFGVPTELYEQLIITDFQNNRDLELANVSQIMLSDNPAVNAYIFGKRMLQSKLKTENRTEMTPAEYHFLEVLHNKTLKKLSWYDIIIVFPTNDTVVQDGTRTETIEDNISIYKAITGFLHAENIPYYFIEGTTQERIKKTYDIIVERYKQSKNPKSKK